MTAGARDPAFGGSGGGGPPTAPPTVATDDLAVNHLYVRSGQPWWDVKAFGALGDGATNDTASIQAAVDACYTAGGGTVYLPPGNFRVTTITKVWASPSITIDIVGAGQIATVLQKFDSSTTPILSLNNAALLQTNSSLRDFRVYGNNKTHDGILLTNVAYCHVANVDVRNCAVAFNLVGSLTSTFRDCMAIDNLTGFKTRAANAVDPNMVKLEDCVIQACTSIGLDIGGSNIGGLFVADHCDIESNGTALNAATGSVLVQNTLVAPSPVVLRDCWFEANHGWDVRALSGDLTVDGCFFYDPELGQAILCDGAKYVRLRNLTSAHGTNTIQINSNADYSYLDNIRSFNTITNNAVYRYMVGVNPLGESPTYVEMGEAASDPGVAAANNGRIFMRDNGSGKTQLCVRFNTGVAIVLATQV